MRYQKILGITAIILALGICGIAEMHSLRQTAETSGETAISLAGSMLREEERCIMSEEELEYINRDRNSNGFVLTEVRENDKLFLEFTRPEESTFSLRINEEQTEAVLTYKEKTAALDRIEVPNGSLMKWNVSAGYGGLVSGYGMPFWMDMTGDGREELLWLCGGGGTGMHQDWCKVFDVVTMKEIPIREPWVEMSEYITVEPQAWRDGYVRCLVRDADGGNYTAYYPAEKEGWQEAVYATGESGYSTIAVDGDKRVLRVSMAYGMDFPQMYGNYMGELSTELAYDRELNMIVRSAPIRVSTYAVIER